MMKPGLTFVVVLMLMLSVTLIPGSASQGSTASPIDQIAQSGDLRVLAVTYSDPALSNVVDIFEAADGQFIHRIPFTVGVPTLITLSPNGERLAVAGNLGGLFVVDVASEAITELIPSGFPQIGALSWSPVHQHLGSSMGTILDLFDGNDGRQLAAGGRMDTFINRITWNPDGTKILIESYYQPPIGVGEVITDTKLWTLNALLSNSNQPEIDLDEIGLGGGPFVWSPNGQMIAVRRPDELLIYDLTAAQLLQRIPHAYGFGDLAWSPLSDELALGIEDGIVIWDTSTWQISRTMAGSNRYTYLAWSPDGQHIFSNLGPEGLYRDDVPVSQLQLTPTPTPSPTPTPTPTPPPPPTTVLDDFNRADGALGGS